MTAKNVLIRFVYIVCIAIAFLSQSTLLPIASAQSTTSSAAKPAVYKPVVGQPHPDFVLPNIANGKPVKLSDFRGKKVLLVHFASW